MRKLMLSSMFVLALGLATPCAFARDDAPDAMLNAVTVEVMSILKQDSDSSLSARTKVADLVEAKVLPLFDFPNMTQSAMARNWRLASAQQQALLVAEFKTLLVHTYSLALSIYPEPVLEFKRMRMSAGDREVRVKSEVKQPGRERIAIDYDLEATPAGWKVYDIKVGGVSMIATYRQTFADAVRDEGIDGLIKSLSDKNRQAGTGVRLGQTTLVEQTRIVFAMLQSVMQGLR